MLSSFDSLEIVFPNNMKSADIKENDVVKDYLAEDFRFDPNSITKFMKHYQRVHEMWDRASRRLGGGDEANTKMQLLIIVSWLQS
jgi:ribosomal protein S18